MQYKLYHGDCLEIMKEIEPGSVDLVLCDPPYGIDFQSVWKKDKAKRFNKIIGDKKPFVEFIPQMIPTVSKSGGCSCLPDGMYSSVLWMI